MPTLTILKRPKIKTKMSTKQLCISIGISEEKKITEKKITEKFITTEKWFAVNKWKGLETLKKVWSTIGE